MDKLKDEYDELDKLKCKFGELDKLKDEFDELTLPYKGQDHSRVNI